LMRSKYRSPLIFGHVARRAAPRQLTNPTY
jgi:hypothetical protein